MDLNSQEFSSKYQISLKFKESKKKVGVEDF